MWNGDVGCDFSGGALAGVRAGIFRGVFIKISMDAPSNFPFHKLLAQDREMKTVLVSGAANGLGAAFVEAYRSYPDVGIITIDISSTSTSHENVESFAVDVADESSIATFVRQIKGRPVDLVIHSAGIRGLVPARENQFPDDVPLCETLDVMDTATLNRTFQINAVGTFSLLRSLLPNLRAAKDPKVVIMSSRMGSISNNELPNKDAGSAYAYRASKAALNMMIRSFAVDIPEVSFILCHPGRVETKLVRCKEAGAITPEESIQSIMPLVEAWGSKDSGKYYDRFGQIIPW